MRRRESSIQRPFRRVYWEGRGAPGCESGPVLFGNGYGYGAWDPFGTRPRRPQAEKKPWYPMSLRPTAAFARASVSPTACWLISRALAMSTCWLFSR